MKLFFKWLFISIILLLIISILFLSKPKADGSLAQLSDVRIDHSLEASGHVTSNQTYSLYSPIDGVVTDFNISLGDSVVNGSVIAKIQVKELEKGGIENEIVLKGQISQADLAVEHATTEYKKISSAINAGVLPQYRLDEVLSKLELARSKSAAATNQLIGFRSDKRSQEKNTLTNQKVNVLSNGIITHKNVLNKQWVRQGDKLLTIISTDELSIKSMMLPEDVRRLRIGQEIIVSQVDTDAAWIERLVKISPIIETKGANRNLQEVTISLSNATTPIQTINEKVLIKIESHSTASRLTLPIEAIIHTDKTYQVLLINRNKPLTTAMVYQEKGYIEAAKHLKCHIFSCNSESFKLQRQTVTLGKSDISRTQILNKIPSHLSVVVPYFESKNRKIITLDK